MLKDEFPAEYASILDDKGVVSKFKLIQLAMKNKVIVQPGISLTDLEDMIYKKLKDNKTPTQPSIPTNYDPLKITPFDPNNVKNMELYKVFRGIQDFEMKLTTRNSKTANAYLMNTLQDLVLETTDFIVHTIVDIHKLQEWQDILELGMKGGVPDDKWEKMIKDCKFIQARISHLL